MIIDGIKLFKHKLKPFEEEYFVGNYSTIHYYICTGCQKKIYNSYWDAIFFSLPYQQKIKLYYPKNMPKKVIDLDKEKPILFKHKNNKIYEVDKKLK